MGMCPSMNGMCMNYFLSINRNLTFMNRIVPFVNRVIPFDFGHRQIDENFNNLTKKYGQGDGATDMMVSMAETMKVR